MTRVVSGKQHCFLDGSIFIVLTSHFITSVGLPILPKGCLSYFMVSGGVKNKVDPPLSVSKMMQKDHFCWSKSIGTVVVALVKNKK